MQIGIVGAGNIGANLARMLVQAGHEVRLANSRAPETLEETAVATGAVAAWASEAVAQAELVILSVPEQAVETLPENLLSALPEGAAVIDTGNYYPGLRDRPIAEIEDGLPESLWVQQQLHRPVIKAFNNIGFTSLAAKGRPSGDPSRIALPVAGDDAFGKSAAMAIVEELGFDAVDAGSLRDSWKQQPGTPVYCTDLHREEVSKALAMADRTKAPTLRDRFIEEMKRRFAAGERPDLIELGRSIYGAP